MLFVGDDWAEDHHDIEIVDDEGKVLVRRRLPEGLEGVTRLHSLIAAQLPDDWVDRDPGEAAALVKVGIETDRGSWVGSLIAAGYEVFAINPMSVARYRERHSTSGANSDAADAHLLAEIVRLDRAHHRPVADDTDQGGVDQADRADSPVPDLGPHPPRGQAALHAAGVLSRGPVGL
jgi:transposase